MLIRDLAVKHQYYVETRRWCCFYRHHKNYAEYSMLEHIVNTIIKPRKKPKLIGQNYSNATIQ